MAEETQDDAVLATYDYVAELMLNGTTDSEVKKNLIEQGLDSELAETVAGNLVVFKKQKKEQGKKYIVLGALLGGIGGLAVDTTISPTEEVGTFVITCGVILCIAISFILRIYQCFLIAKSERFTASASTPKPPVNLAQENYIGIEEFAKRKNIEKDKVIKMVRDGFYNGHLFDGEWHVHKSEL